MKFLVYCLVSDQSDIVIKRVLRKHSLSNSFLKELTSNHEIESSLLEDKINENFIFDIEGILISKANKIKHIQNHIYLIQKYGKRNLETYTGKTITVNKKAFGPIDIEDIKSATNVRNHISELEKEILGAKDYKVYKEIKSLKIKSRKCIQLEKIKMKRSQNKLEGNLVLMNLYKKMEEIKDKYESGIDWDYVCIMTKNIDSKESIYFIQKEVVQYDKSLQQLNRIKDMGIASLKKLIDLYNELRKAYFNSYGYFCDFSNHLSSVFTYYHNSDSIGYLID